MTCVLRAYGEKFNVDDFLPRSHLVPCKVWHRGEPRFPSGRGGNWSHSGMNVDVSDAELEDLPRQIRDAMRFLRRNQVDLKKIGVYPGLQALFLDFGVARQPDALMQGAYFPANLVRACGELGIGLKVSEYAVKEDDQPRSRRRVAGGPKSRRRTT